MTRPNVVEVTGCPDCPLFSRADSTCRGDGALVYFSSRNGFHLRGPCPLRPENGGPVTLRLKEGV